MKRQVCKCCGKWFTPGRFNDNPNICPACDDDAPEVIAAEVKATTPETKEKRG